MNYELKKMSGDRAKKILEDLLRELSGIDPDQMTTFELHVLHRSATEPPKKYRGCEEELV